MENIGRNRFQIIHFILCQKFKFQTHVLYFVFFIFVSLNSYFSKMSLLKIIYREKENESKCDKMLATGEFGKEHMRVFCTILAIFL